MKLTSRQWFFITFLFTSLVLAGAAYFQWVKGYEPCPLCILQRVTFLACAIISLVAVLAHPKKLGIYIYSSLLLLLAIIGAFIAARQVWLQHLPPGQAPSCGPGLNFILTNLPPMDAVRELFYGSASCAQVEWEFLGLSFAGWSFCLFFLLGLICIKQLIKPRYIANSTR